MSLKMNAEEVKVGGYQILTLLLLSVNLIIVAMSHALTIFYKYTPKFYCQETSSASSTTPASPELHARNRTYGCERPRDGGAGVFGCPGQYLFAAGSEHERTVAMEWQLVCEREALLRAGGDVYYAGLVLGGLVAGVVADRIGRLPVLAICLYAQGTMAVALNVVQEYQLFLVFRGLQGFFIQGLESCTFILCMELFPAKFRTLIALIILSMRSFGLALLAGLSYTIPDWRILQLVVSVPTAVTVLYIWMIPESPRWLLAKGKLTEAEMLLERIAHYNGLCGLSKKNEDPEKVQQHSGGDASAGDREKPQKPKRKTPPSAADLKSTETSDVEKSLEESEILLPSAEQDESPRAHASTEEKNVEEIINMNMDEITKASLLVVTDEKSALNDKSEEATGPSYLLVSREALSDNGNQKGKDTKITKRGFLGFLESKFIGRICIIQMCLWFSSSTAFHALVSLPHRLSGERHVSLTLAAGMEVVSFVITYLLVSTRCGRRGPLCAAQLLVGTSCLAIAVFAVVQQPVASVAWLVHLKTAVVTLGRITNIATFFILRLVVIELFPTISRGTGLGLCISAEMIGGLLMPYILMLNSYVPELARFIIGASCICTGFLTLMIPETSHDILPDSADDAKNLGQTGKHRNNENENPEVLREKLFSEDWVDAGNGIIVNFTDKKNPE